MKVLRLFAGALVLLGLVVPAWADVRTIHNSQLLALPAGQTYALQKVAIDGASIIVLASHAGGQSALLYQRASGSSPFTYRKTLITFPYPRERLQVRMTNGIAVVHFGDRAWIFELIGNTYVLGRTAAPLRHPGGVAISGNRVLIGGDNCDYDAVVYEKGADGTWTITGRLDDNQGQCQPDGLGVELSYDYALLRTPGTHEVTTWRRNGAALDWVSAGSMVISSDVASTTGPFTLQKATAVTPASHVFRREAASWNPKGRVVPLDFGQGTGSALEVNYRDGVLITTERPIASSYAQPYVYVETVPGEFEHVAILHTWYDTIDHDVSGRTVVAIDTVANSQRVNVFVLPEPLMAAAAVPNDFEDGDASDFTNASGQFALATRGNNEVLTPTTTTGLNIAVVQDSDWNYYQRIEAGIAPSFAATDGWVGLVARYVDADNYYYLAVHNDNTTRLYRRLEGVDTLLAESRFDGPMASRIALYVDDGIVNAWVDEQFTLSAADRSLPHGRAGLATFRAGADFDDVHVAAAGRRTLLVKEYLPQESPTRFDLARPFSRISGDWQYRFDVNGWINGFQQRDPSRSAFAFVGGQVRNQEIEAVVQINAVSDATAAWVGVLGRYVDARTHYYATLRKTNRVEIRKQVNGVVTVLAAANFALEDGRFYTMNFRIVEDQLQLFIDDVQMLSARDDEISEGQHGLATHRAAATWNWVVVRQP